MDLNFDRRGEPWSRIVQGREDASGGLMVGYMKSSAWGDDKKATGKGDVLQQVAQQAVDTGESSGHFMSV